MSTKLTLKKQGLSPLAKVLIEVSKVAFGKPMPSGTDHSNKAAHPNYGDDVHLGVGADNFRDPKEGTHHAM